MERCCPPLSAETPTGAPPTAESLLQNQSQCWLRGEPQSVESYLRLHPELHADRELVLDLICHEILLRTQPR